MAAAHSTAGPAKDQGEVIAFLSRPETYGPEVATVERIDTHISALFLAGTRVYKLKRAVTFPYLDFTEPEARRRYCETEVEINRRTAPGIYEGVLPVTRDASLRSTSMPLCESRITTRAPFARASSTAFSMRQARRVTHLLGRPGASMSTMSLPAYG